MADVNILEFLVYALVCYAGIIGLIISAFRNPPANKGGSIIRAIWLIPSIICASMLASIGGFDVVFDNTATTNTIINLNTTEVFTESFNKTSTYTILNEAWVPLHGLFFVVMMFYVFYNIIILFYKRE